MPWPSAAAGGAIAKGFANRGAHPPPQGGLAAQGPSEGGGRQRNGRAGPPGQYTPQQMTYDLRRLRLKEFNLSPAQD